MVCNEEEYPKSPFNGRLKAYNIAINFGRWFHQNQGPKSKNQQVHLIEGHPGSAQQAALCAPPKYCRENTKKNYDNKNQLLKLGNYASESMIIHT